MKKQRLNLWKGVISGVVALALNAMLVGYMSKLSYQEKIAGDQAYDKPILLVMPEKQPPMEKQKPKKLKKPEAPKTAQKPKTLDSKLAKAPPKFEFEKPGDGFALNGNLTSAISVSLPTFTAPKSFFELTELDRVPRVVYRVAPVYPYSAKRKNITGSITLQFLVDDEGKVGHIEIVKAAPEGIFEKSAVNAVQKWRFQPGYFQDKPVATRVILPINFTI